MAVDEALLEAVGSGQSGPVVRLYGFSPATLSLGRFQRVQDRLIRSCLTEDGITLVRRPTGGHAVLHDDELTYSVCLPKAVDGEMDVAGERNGAGETDGARDAQAAARPGKAAGIGARKRAVYELIAGVLLRGLANLGVEGRVNASRQGDLHDPDCFASAGEYEITAVNGRKLIGSAQMTTRLAILQHGSIPMSNPGNRVRRYVSSAGDPNAGGQTALPPTCLNELTGRALSYQEVQDAFARAFQDAVGAVSSEISPAEREAADRILKERYSSDAWNLAR